MEGLAIIFFFISSLFCMDIKDSFDREIKLTTTPQRVIAIGPGALRMVSYLNSVDKIVGIENIEVKYPKGRAYSVKNYEVFRKLPIIGEGGADKKPDYERIILLKPDIIIASSFTRDIIEDLEKNTKIKVVAFDYGSLGSFETNRFKEVILKMGKILGREKRAEFLVNRIDKYLLDLKKRTKTFEIKKKIYVGGIGFKGSHGITSTQYMYEPFNILGIRSVIDKNDNNSNDNFKHIFISKETLLSLDPDVIFIDLGGVGIIESDYKNDKNFYQLLKAFKNGNVYTTLPFNYYTTNVDVVFLNAYFIGKVLLPDFFKDVDMSKKCSEIMVDFVGEDVCDRFVDDKNFYKKVIIENGNFRYKDI